MMRPAVLLSGLFALLALSSPLRAQSREANIFYFDEDFNLRFSMIGGVEGAGRSTDTLKIESVTTERAYTDGRRFILERPQDLTLDELNGTTNYVNIADTEVLLSGKSFLSSPDGFSPGLARLLADHLTRYTVITSSAALVRGVTPRGRTFLAVELPGRKADNFWSFTVNMVYTLSRSGTTIKIVESSFPLGLNGFSRTARDNAVYKSSNVLVGIGLGDAASVLESPLEKIVSHLTSFNTDLVALRPADLPYLWREVKKGDYVPPAAPVFLCSNIEVNDSRLAAVVKPYVITDLGGVKTAFVSFIPSNSEELADFQGVPLSIKDPVNFGSDKGLLDELKTNQKVKFIVAIAELKEDLGALIAIPGIDVVIGPKGWEQPGSRRESMDFSGWDNDYHNAPAVVLFPDSRGVGEISLSFTEKGSLSGLRNQSLPLADGDVIYAEEYGALKEKVAQVLYGSNETVLPDRRYLYPDEAEPSITYSRLDFANIMASTMKNASDTELAFVKIRSFDSNMLGEVSASMVKNWLGQDDDMVTAWLPGSIIRSLMPRFEFRRPGDKKIDEEKYRRRDYFAVSGVSSNGLISGLPIKDSELYLAAVPAKFLQSQEKYPQLKNARVLGKNPKSLNTLVIENLRKIKKYSPDKAAWTEAVREMVDNQPEVRPVWRLNIRDLSLQAYETRVNNTESFSQVSDSRLRTVRQNLIQGSGRVFSEFYKGDLRLDSGVSADYGKLTLRPKDQPAVKTESVDQLILESEFKYKYLRWNNFMGSMLLGPFFNLAYDTEFTHQPDLPKRKIVRGTAGVKLFEGAYLRELYAAMVTEQNYTHSPAHTNYGGEVGFGVDTMLPGTALKLYADGSYRNYANSRFDTTADLKQRLELNFRLSTKLYGDIMISPFFNFFLATGKVSHATATNLMTGVSLNYSRLCKLKY